ncbi:MAG: pyruvate kinase [Candidatus Absconditabacterales bacterium]|nr:pyruvate kinase [Candidatus Absconditabacterales bacterium]
MFSLVPIKLAATVAHSLTKETVLAKIISYFTVLRVAGVEVQYDDYQRRYIETVLKIDNAKTIFLETRGEEALVQNIVPLIVKKSQKRKVEFSNLKEDSHESIFVSYSHLHSIPVGTRLVFSSAKGSIGCVVEKNQGGVVTVKIDDDGEIHGGMRIEFVSYQPMLSFLSEKDRQDILWGLSSHVSIVVANSIKSKEQIFELRNFLDANGGQGVRIFLKIASRDMLPLATSLLDYCQGCMIVFDHLVRSQPALLSEYADVVNYAKQHSKTVFFSIDSFLYQGYDAFFQSFVQYSIGLGVDCLVCTHDFCASAPFQDSFITLFEKLQQSTYTYFHKERYQFFENRALSHGDIQKYLLCDVYRAMNNFSLRAVIVFTNTGSSIASLVALMPNVPILAFTKSEAVYRYVNVMWGVKPYKLSQTSSSYAFFKSIGKEVLRVLYKGNISLDDKIVIMQTHEEDNKDQTYFINGMELYKFKDL